jgi:4-hydroxy-2-oxoheptanedioate aldolase
MAQNRVKETWKRGEIAYGAWLSIPSSLSSEALGRAGFDYVCVDLQHGLIDYPTAAEMLVAINSTGATPFVRVPANDFSAINRALDAGALGIIVPMIHSSDDVYRAVSACRYPPEGTRSYGPVRASMTLGPDYFEAANELVACVPMIETRQAVEEIDAIISLPGVDAVYVGPNDLSLSMGQKPGADNDGSYQQAYRAIGETCATRGVVAGIHGNSELAPKHAANGYRMITVSSDLGLLQRGAVGDLERAKRS